MHNFSESAKFSTIPFRGWLIRKRRVGPTRRANAKHSHRSQQIRNGGTRGRREDSAGAADPEEDSGLMSTRRKKRDRRRRSRTEGPCTSTESGFRVLILKRSRDAGPDGGARRTTARRHPVRSGETAGWKKESNDSRRASRSRF